MNRPRNTIKVPSSTEARTGPWSVPMRKQHAMKYDGIMVSVAMISALYAWFTIQFTSRPAFLRTSAMVFIILAILSITTTLERLSTVALLLFLSAHTSRCGLRQCGAHSENRWENRWENRCLECRVHPPGRNRNKKFRYQRRYLRRRIIPIQSSRHAQQGLSKNYAYVKDIPLYAIAELPDCRIRGHHFLFNEKLKTDNENDRRTPQRLSTSYRDNDDGDRHVHGKLFREAHLRNLDNEDCNPSVDEQHSNGSRPRETDNENDWQTPEQLSMSSHRNRDNDHGDRHIDGDNRDDQNVRKHRSIGSQLRGDDRNRDNEDCYRIDVRHSVGSSPWEHSYQPLGNDSRFVTSSEPRMSSTTGKSSDSDLLRHSEFECKDNGWQAKSGEIRQISSASSLRSQKDKKTTYIASEEKLEHIESAHTLSDHTSSKQSNAIQYSLSPIITVLRPNQSNLNVMSTTNSDGGLNTPPPDSANIRLSMVMPRPGQPGAMQFDGTNITEFSEEWNSEDFGLTNTQRC